MLLELRLLMAQRPEDIDATDEELRSYLGISGYSPYELPSEQLQNLAFSKFQGNLKFLVNRR